MAASLGPGSIVVGYEDPRYDAPAYAREFRQADAMRIRAGGATAADELVPARVETPRIRRWLAHIAAARRSS